jgi:PadR family transcriptional regulator PadR
LELIRQFGRPALPLITDKSAAILLSVSDGGRVSKPTDLVQGTLDLLILRVIALEPMHGWAVAQRIRQMSNDELRVGQGSLYPALHKLEQQGWIAAEWGESENNRRAKFYSLTRAGRKALETESAQWERLSAAISLVIRRA